MANLQNIKIVMDVAELVGGQKRLPKGSSKGGQFAPKSGGPGSGSRKGKVGGKMRGGITTPASKGSVTGKWRKGKGRVIKIYPPPKAKKIRLPKTRSRTNKSRRGKSRIR